MEIIRHRISKISDTQQLSEALKLAIKVFMIFEAPDYPATGVEEFMRSMKDPEYVNNLCTYAAFDGCGNIVGMLATRDSGRHIALFFVDPEHQRHGIGGRLFDLAKKDCPSKEMTVNSSPWALPVYEKLGFKATDTEQIVNGIRFTPMTNHL